MNKIAYKRKLLLKYPTPPELSPEEHLDRYQYQRWYNKVWRSRHYALAIPSALLTWILSKIIPGLANPKDFNLKDYLELYISRADEKARNYYVLSELEYFYGDTHLEDWSEDDFF